MSTRYRRVEAGGRRHRVVLLDGVEGFIVRGTATCAGCFEPGDYMGNAHLYGYDAKACCYVGSGCDECGYTGKRRWREWVPFNLSEDPRLPKETPNAE